MSAPALLEALATAGRALDEGDAVAASAAMERAQQARLALEASGQRLDPADLARARELHAACGSSITRCRARLAEALELSGRSLRAAEAYRR